MIETNAGSDGTVTPATNTRHAESAVEAVIRPTRRLTFCEAITWNLLLELLI